MMRRKLTFLMFGLLLAVGWTNSAQAQQLPAESVSQKFAKAATTPKYAVMDVQNSSEAHSPSPIMPQKHASEPKSLQINKMTSLSKGDFNVKKESSRTNSRHNAPSRVGQDLEMKSISKADADLITYTWDNGDGQGPRSSKATDVARDPYQMYALLREVYTNKDFPGPYYSAFTMDDQRERKVYYGAIEGGWNITGPTVSGVTSSLVRTTTQSALVADGTSTNEYVPVYGYWYDNNQKNQMIYPSSLLSAQGIEDGTVITSITFYAYRKYWYGGSVKLSLGETTTTTFSDNALLTDEVTEVKAAFTPPSTTGVLEWTITFDTPYTYHGGNLLVQVETTAGSYGQSGSAFYGVTNTGYSSCYKRGSQNPSRQQFLPKASFGYKTEEVVQFDPTQQIGDIVITGTNYANITSIVVSSGNTVITSFTADPNNTTLPTGWTFDAAPGLAQSDGSIILNTSNDGSNLIITSDLLIGYTSVNVAITGYNYPATQGYSGTTYPGYVYIGNLTGTFTSGNGQTVNYPITGTTYAHTEYDPDYYLPNKEGYTALIVAVKDNATQSDPDNYDDTYENGYHDTPQKIINYLANNVDSIILLTDGMRMGEASDYSIGTLFNCAGTYNKFFFLGKGQARQKADIIRVREISSQHLIGEEVPFRFMFEQFSPTSGDAGAQTENFYSKMMEGNVYNVVHDCRSVIGNGHQFSMSGNNGTTPYAMTGMNFFIPDYRLKYWTDDNYYVQYYHIDEETGEIVWTPDGPYVVDGRIMNPYQTESENGSPIYNPSKLFTPASELAVWYAQYNQQYPPKVGLYKITLEAVAEPRPENEMTHDPNNENYLVTLTWVSSLDEMTGHEVEQTYTVYYYDENGDRQYLVVTGYTTTNGETHETTLQYYVPQKEHSYTIDYVVVGTPDDGDHTQFIAESNIATVVIPGWEDFVGLQLDHHESDFVAGDMANYYRNFLTVVNEDIYNGLTVSKITGYNADDPTSPLTPMNKFNLYRWAIKDGVDQPEEKVAVLEFNSATEDQVHYNIYYEDNNSEYTDLTDQDILDGPTGNTNKYQRSTMGIPDDGWVRVKGNGDLVIWPNGYHVNFKSITVKNNGSLVTSWTAPNAKPSSWKLSPGSQWVSHTLTGSDDQVMYIEGGGYIYIPDIVSTTNNTNLTVEIVAYGDGANVSRIAVNDESKIIANGSAATYNWGTAQKPISPNAVPKREIVTESTTIHENGTTTNTYLPVFGYFYDYRQQWSQIIYTADQLSDLEAGDVIKSITFYPTTTPFNLTGGTIHVYMAPTTQSNFDAAFQPATVDYNTTLVATYTPAGNIDCSNGWTINLDTPYTYDGGNLIIDIDTEIGTTYTEQSVGFYGAETSSYMGLFLYYETSGSNTGWTGGRFNFQPKITFTYDTEGNETPPEPLEATDAGLLRLHLMMVDQFKEEIPDNNKHPKRYGYILRYEPEGEDPEESGTVYVNIEKTQAKVNGYYTKDEIDHDTNEDTTLLTMNVLTADVEMDLDNENPNILYFEMKGKKDNYPVAQDPYLTKLQYMKNIRKYQEMEPTSIYYGGDPIDPADGTHHYYDDRTPIVVGTYADQNFMTYAPMVSTWGIDRRYFEDDDLDNTYGAPIWKTSVGDVEIKSTPAIQKQVVNAGTNDEGVNPYTSWKVGNQLYSLFFLDVKAQGTLPNPSVTNIKYEPYMFRVFVEGTSEGKLRRYEKVMGDGGGYYLVDAGPLEGKYCVGSFYVNDGWDANSMFFSKTFPRPNTSLRSGGDEFDPNAWDGYMKFGAVDGLKGTDVNVFVRFYYMVEGWNANRDGDGDARPGNGSESDPGAPGDPSTAVYEFYGMPSIVGVTYYNAQGMQSDKPFDGLNIIVTRYSDGTTSSIKVMR